MVKIRNINIRSNWIFPVLVAIFIITVSITVPGFLSIGNIKSIFIQATVVGLLVIGITPVLILRGIDLSMPAVLATSAILGTYVMQYTKSTILGILTILAICMIIGVFKGFCITKLKMVPFIVTLSLQMVGAGFVVWLTKSESIFGMTKVFINLGTGKIGFLPIPVVFLSIALIISHLMLSKSFIGRWVYAIGSSEEISELWGIPTAKIIFWSYVVCGFFIGLATIMEAARFGSAGPTMSVDVLTLDVLSAAVIGGVSISGGKGTIIGAVAGAIFMAALTNALVIIGIPFAIGLAIRGSIIVLAISLDSLSKLQQNT